MEQRSFATRRRTFVLGATVGLVVPANARAQKRRRIGFLTATPLERLATQPYWLAFLDALRTYGWSEGNNLEIIARGTGGDQRKVPVLTDELLGEGVELVVSSDTPSTEALLQRTKTVPIIMIGSADPVAAGLVSSLARPGGNVTGLSDDLTDLNLKYIDFTRQLVPGLRRLAVMFNPDNQAAARDFHRFETVASSFGIESFRSLVATSDQLEPALAGLARERPQILIVLTSQPLNVHSARIAEYAIRQRIVPLGKASFQVRAGFLLSFGPDLMESIRRVAYYVDRILRGAAPRDLPVELTTARLEINLKTAHALGIAVPQSLLLRADEVIR